MNTAPRLIWPAGALLGEGPAWFATEGLLRFVDIKSGKLHAYEPATGKKTTLDVGGRPSFVLPAEGGNVVVGSMHGIYRLENGQLGAPIAEVVQPANNRLNDATVDALGRLWFGTMDDNETMPSGRLHCLDEGSLHSLGCDAIVTNGPAVTPDGTTLYHVDSGARTIWRLTIGEGPAITARSVFVQLGEDEGHPDGVVLDSEDCLWVALWDGWGVRRYAPDGKLLLEVALPCARVTKLAFGGPELRTAYVTTARVGLDAEALAAQPLAGGLFAFDAPAPGRTLPSARLP